MSMPVTHVQASGMTPVVQMQQLVQRADVSTELQEAHRGCIILEDDAALLVSNKNAQRIEDELRLLRRQHQALEEQDARLSRKAPTSDAMVQTDPTPVDDCQPALALALEEIDRLKVEVAEADECKRRLASLRCVNDDLQAQYEQLKAQHELLGTRHRQLRAEAEQSRATSARLSATTRGSTTRGSFLTESVLRPDDTRFWNHDHLRTVVTELFPQHDADGSGRLDWDSGEVVKFLEEFFKKHDMPPPALPKVLYSQLYAEVKNADGNDTPGLDIEGMVSYAKKVHDLIYERLAGEVRHAESKRTSAKFVLDGGRSSNSTAFKS